jgi:hypothetical protein
MVDFTYAFCSALFAVLLGGGFFMLTPVEERRLECARRAFCGAAVCLFIIAIVGIGTSAPNRLILFVSATICGAIIGVLTLAMWLGINHEISQLHGKSDRQ